MAAGSLSRAVAGLFPGYFALVMATGIVSIALALLEWPLLAWPLLGINVAAYAVLWLLTLGRILAYPRRVLEDLASHQRGPAFFTLVAGTGVLGTQLLVLTGQRAVPAALWGLGLALWAVLTYAFFTSITIKAVKPALDDGINGTWLISIVATQSMSVLGTLLAPPGHPRLPLVFFGTLCLYLVGCLLYLILITLIVYRLTFFSLETGQLTPPYWINMGAVAITTLAGAVLVIRAPEDVLLADLLPFLKGFTLFFWAWGTWWIPLLVIFGVWRHLVRRHVLAYDPQYWGLVFPLGMYTTCTIRLSQALEAPFLMAVPRVFVWVAFTAWSITFLGLLKTLLAPAPAETPTRPG